MSDDIDILNELVSNAKKEIKNQKKQTKPKKLTEIKNLTDSEIDEIKNKTDITVREVTEIISDIAEIIPVKDIKSDIGIKITGNDNPATIIKKIADRDFLESELDDFNDPQPELDVSGCPVIGIVGDKGTGKTFFALSAVKDNETMLAISFDRKTKPIHKLFFDNKPNIKVFNAVKYLRRHPSLALTETSEKTIIYIRRIIENIKQKGGVDYIFLDALEIYAEIAEFAMRYENNLTAYQGILNRNLWKQRKQNVNMIQELASQTARKLVMYSTYPTLEEYIDENGVECKRKKPNWKDIIEKEIDDVIVMSKEKDKEGELRFFAYVDSAKFLFKTGKICDVTGTNGFHSLLSEE